METKWDKTTPMAWRGQPVPVGAVRGLEGSYKFLNSHRLHSSGPASAVSYTATPGFSQNTQTCLWNVKSEPRWEKHENIYEKSIKTILIIMHLCSWPASVTPLKSKKPRNGCKSSSELNSPRVKSTKMSSRTELSFASWWTKSLPDLFPRSTPAVDSSKWWKTSTSELDAFETSQTIDMHFIAITHFSFQLPKCFEKVWSRWHWRIPNCWLVGSKGHLSSHQHTLCPWQTGNDQPNMKIH